MNNSIIQFALCQVQLFQGCGKGYGRIGRQEGKKDLSQEVIANAMSYLCSNCFVNQVKDESKVD